MSNVFTRKLVLAILLGWILCPRAGFAVLKPDEVLIVANSRVAESLKLARFYAEKRSIPYDRICVLDLPPGERIARTVYERDLREALLDFLARKGLVEFVEGDKGQALKSWRVVSSRIRAVVLMYGVPLRIESVRWKLLRKLDALDGEREETDAAAVESELALAFAREYDYRGYIQNPLFRRLTTEPQVPVLMVTRLDGPSPATVRRMIEDSLWAERCGLQGVGYYDAMGSKGGPYDVGDYWIREACERFGREGYEGVLDQDPRMFGAAYPMEAAAFYFGWYAPHVVGPFANTNFSFMRGAIAAHIHSTSAEKLRTETEFWAGPLLARGASATWGAVNEPYLNFMPHIDIFADRLCRGLTYAESVYLAMPVLSWQIAIVGDPLYRPFAHSLDAQIRELERDGAREVEWAWIRKINLLVREGRLNPALDFAREKVEQTGSTVVLEKLGDLYALNGLLPDAIRCYERILDARPSPIARIRVESKLDSLRSSRGHAVGVQEAHTAMDRSSAESRAQSP